MFSGLWIVLMPIGYSIWLWSTEAQDWAEMILRMYLRWGEQHGFATELMECSPGDVAGNKSATIHFAGEYAFGWLRTETGVHR